MDKKKITPIKCLSLLILTLLASCSSEPISSSISTSEENVIPPYLKVGSTYSLLEGVKEDVANGFYDGFETLNPSSWIIGDGYWGVNNGGVSPENVFITDDGQLMLRGLGSYYSKNEFTSHGAYKDGRRSGACLISKFGIKPGHYEIRMKVLPRQGACSAFWTYGNRPSEGQENENAEIDVELPGGSKSNKITFKKALNTNWVSESASDSVEYAISEVDPNASYVAYNDNKYHTFGFDWYSDPQMVVYFCDDKITNVSTLFVPELEGRLWLGVWFPNGFVGASNFEEDYMYVDYVKYNPFLNQNVTSYDAKPTISEANQSYYSNRIREELKGNKISNGDFEFVSNLDASSSNYKDLLNSKGFEFTKRVSEKQNQEEVCFPIENTIYKDGGKYLAFVKDGGVLRQDVDSVYDDFEYDFSFVASSSDLSKNHLKATIKFLGSSEEEILLSKQIGIDSSSFKKYETTLKAPKGSESLRFELRGEKGVTCYIDNIKLIQK